MPSHQAGQPEPPRQHEVNILPPNPPSSHPYLLVLLILAIVIFLLVTTFRGKNAPEAPAAEQAAPTQTVPIQP